MSAERVRLSEAQRKCLTEATRGCVHTFARGAYRRRGTKEAGAFNSRTLLALDDFGLLARRGTEETWDITDAGRAALGGDRS